jgi:hypothetical protein
VSEQRAYFLRGNCIAVLSNSYQRNADDIPDLLITRIRRGEKRVQFVMVFIQNDLN